MELSFLTEVHRLASSLSDFLNDIHPPTHTPLHLSDQTIPTFYPPSFPESILEPIVSLRIPEGVRNALTQRFTRLMHDLQAQYAASYQETCLKTIQVPAFGQDFEALNKVYISLFKRQCIPMVESKISAVVTQIASLQRGGNVLTKQPFNNECTPMLEKYFQFNGYPSTVHRSILAEKFAMAPRQIEVWFQNHRNRAKKEGRPIPRLDSDVPLKHALQTLQQHPPNIRSRLLTPPMDDNHTKPVVQLLAQNSYPSSPQHAPSTTLHHNSGTILDDSYPHRPPHAFPSTSSSDYPDPFPTEHGVFRLPTPVWRRKPATVPIVSMIIDMDEFAQTFHLKLNFSEIGKRRGTTPTKQDTAFRPWFSSTTTFTSLAPHPALLHSSYNGQLTNPISTSSCSSFNFVPTFGSTSLSLSKASLSLPPNQGVPRKVRPLPRRTPTESRSNSFSSRTSSFGSDTSSSSSRSRLSSSSSNYSSPELATPPTLPHVDLPVVHDHVEHQQLFDFSQTTLDTNLTLSNLFDSQDYNFSDPSSKSIDIPWFDNNFGHDLGHILS